MPGESGEQTSGRRVIAAETSALMRRLLRAVVTRGTGSKADAPGYSVGGKTGTARKIGEAGYRRDALLSSFIGAFPIVAPRYIVLAILDEPQGNESTMGYASGGWTAAPVVGRVIARIAPLLGVAPANEDAAPERDVLLVEAAGGGEPNAAF
jgi:cell division protein FtsI (penicillin-binding protein 3)